MKRYFHMFANGDDAKDFITTIEEFKRAFNRFGVCSHLSGATVVSASVEDSHPHVILWGTYEECTSYKNYYEDLSKRSIVQQRGSLDGVNLNCELCEIDSDLYLKNAAAYTIVQATKDGKAVMPYDYLYGTGALYFRSTKTPLPGEWMACNGFIMPDSYVDIKRFESIFVTHNCYRVFLASNKAKDEMIRSQMASARGVMLEDLEARRICRDACLSLFGRQGTRHLTMEQRIGLALHLRSSYHTTFRQLSTLTKIPEVELRKYIR